MNYIRRIGRDEMYIKYVHQLANVQLINLIPDVNASTDDLL
jgi:hypothetical protein